MEKKHFIDRHPDLTTTICVVLWALAMAFVISLSSCKSSQKVVEIVKTDTLHVFHTDTLKVVHNDTVFSFVTQTVHDSIIKETIIREVVNEAGEVIHSEKETNNEHWHNSDNNSKLIQHTVDSILQAKLDSINHSQYEEKPVVVEVEKKEPWYAKVWNWIVRKFAWVGLIVIVGVILYFVVKHFKPKL